MNRKVIHILKCCVGLAVWLAAGCKQPYTPPALKTNYNYLVVDGFINGGPDSTIITLSRTRSLVDSIPNTPELQAQVTVEGQAADLYPLQELGNGIYAISQLSLNTNENYRLRIVTSNGEQYLSDFVPFKPTPPIDSVTWRQDSIGITVYANTHDPTNNTRYYRWDYVETWQYRTNYFTGFDFINGAVVQRLPNQLIYDCWSTANSTSINVNTSAKLSQDVISNIAIANVASGDERLSVKYSIQVRQYALTLDAFNYWENLQKTTENLGTLFDPQPSQLTGNIHCVNNPAEPVLGYITASTRQTQRIFVSSGQVGNWNYIPYYGACAITSVQNTDILQYFPIGQQSAFTFIGQNNLLYLMSTPECADCRAHGGSNLKPSFWQ